MDGHHIGQRLSYDGAVCTVRYIGPVAGTTGTWLGVEWDDITRGKHDGSHKGARYFSCVSTSKSHARSAASFVRPTRPAEKPRSFLAALREKYVLDSDSARPRERIYFSTKLAEEVGFDKIWRQQSQLQKLRIVVLEGSRVAWARGRAGKQLEDGERKTNGEEEEDEKEEDESVRATCPMIVQLDLSRNLFEGMGPVVDICGELRDLQKLSINGNRFGNVLEDEALRLGDGDGTTQLQAFAKVRELALADTMLGWEELVYVAGKFPALTTLLVGTNQLSRLPRLSPSSPTCLAQSYAFLSTTLTSINLEFNDFCSIDEIASLADLKALRSIYLKGNSISSLAAAAAAAPGPEESDLDGPVPAPAPAPAIPIRFPPAVEYLDLSYNKVASWDFIDGLTAYFPGLVALRISHNPIYDDFVNPAQGGGGGDSSSSAAQSQSSDDSFMFTVARIAQLKTLNFSSITAADRSNAEMFYLSRIAKQLATVPEAAERGVTASHPRWEELCGVYGRPGVDRRVEVNPSFLEARLIDVLFHIHRGGGGDGEGREDKGREREERTLRIPKSFDIYRVKGIVGRLFGVEPLKTRLVWETGDWDPVAGFDETDDDDDEDESEHDGDGEEEEEDAGDLEAKDQPGRWVKREVELRDGPKLLGYCVDGSKVTIRVESLATI